MTKVAMDTSVIIEYIDTNGELHEQAKTTFSALLTSKLEVILPHPILAETYYVATKLYDKLKIENPQILASKFIEWLYRLPTTTIPNADTNLAIETGKAKLNYSLALTDCYVLAASKIHGCKALF
ncbi:MAG: PIN domain-containing protein, partial [Thermoproteota archaeon]|nr:PIN domain-containing protein [Thermoproteota archaeon]